MSRLSDIRSRAKYWNASRKTRSYSRNPERYVRREDAKDRMLSRVPVYRNKPNPAHGRPRWTDRNENALGRWRAERDKALANRPARPARQSEQARAERFREASRPLADRLQQGRTQGRSR